MQAEWQIQELGPSDLGSLGPAAADRRLRAASIAVAIVVAVGLVGSFADLHPRSIAATAVPLTRVGDTLDGPADEAAQPKPLAARATSEPALSIVEPALSIVEPAAGGAVDGAVIGVRATTTSALPSLLLAAVIGDAEIGRVSLRNVPAGPVRTDLPVFAPPVAVGVELLALSPAPERPDLFTADGLRRAAIDDQALLLHPNGPIGLWPPSATRTGNSVSIRASGCAPLALGKLTLRLVARDGRLLDQATVAIARDDRLPGAIGGHAFGLGSFAISLTAPGSMDALRVEVDWRDPVSSSWGTSVQRMDLAAAAPRPGA